MSFFTSLSSLFPSVQFWASERGASGRAAPAARWAGFQPTAWRRSRPRPPTRGAVSLITRGCVAVGGGTLTYVGRAVCCHPVLWREREDAANRSWAECWSFLRQRDGTWLFSLQYMSCVSLCCCLLVSFCLPGLWRTKLSATLPC